MIRRCVVSWLCLVAFAVSAYAAETFERTIEVNGALELGARLAVDNLLGTVTLRSGAVDGRFSVEAQVVAEAKTEQEARELAESVRLDRPDDDAGPRVHVRYPVDRFAAFRPPKAGVKGLITRWTAPLLRQPSTVEYDGRLVQVGPDRRATGLAVHLTVTLPIARRTEIHQTLGWISAVSLNGEFSLQVQDGAIDVEQLFGTLDVVTERAEVTLQNVQGDRLDVRTGSGDLHVQKIRVHAARLRSATGSIRGGDIQVERLDIETSGGEVKLAGVEPVEARIDTGTGDVDLATRLFRTKQATIHSSAGDVILRVGERSFFELQATTASGQVKTLGLDLETVKQDGRTSWLQRGSGGGAELRVEAGSETIVRPYDASRLDILIGKSSRR